MTQRSEDFFALPSLPWMLLILLGLYMLFGAVFLPSLVPLDYLGPMGLLIKILKTDYPSVLMFLVVFTVVCHSVEAIYCMQMCGRKNISQSCRVKWFLSTMMFGGFSLYKLSQFQQGDAKHKE